MKSLATAPLFAALGVLISLLGSLVAPRLAQAVTPNQAVYAWGDNYFGQLGDGTQFIRANPIQSNGLSGVTTAVAVGDAHSVALKSDGTV